MCDWINESVPFLVECLGEILDFSCSILVQLLPGIILSTFYYLSDFHITHMNPF